MSAEVVEVTFRTVTEAERVAKELMKEPPKGMCGLRWTDPASEPPTARESVIHVWFTARGLKTEIVGSIFMLSDRGKALGVTPPASGTD